MVARPENGWPVPLQVGGWSKSGTTHLLASRRLANFGVAQAKIWRESGRTTEAADPLLDVSMFARDLGANGVLLTTLLGDAAYLITLNEFRNLILSGI